jgi:hypothetical protein
METLEEAFEFWSDRQSSYDKLDILRFGAVWQQERSYSEEEIKSAFKVGFSIGYGSTVQELDLKNEYCEKWFEQFKK